MGLRMANASDDNTIPKESSLWINRVCSLVSTSSGRSCREQLEEWKVHRHIVDVLESHITRLLPFQEKVIPILLSCDALDRYSVASSDLVITAPTGQGKTLCYLLPIVDSIVKHKRVGLSALIIAPTRELVHQIYDFAAWFLDSDPATYDLKGDGLLQIYSCHGNTSFITDHLFLLENQPQIVVFTPGRFMEHFNHLDTSYHKKVDFSTLKWIIIDEVDLLLSQSFYNWTSAVSTICKECQALDAKIGEHTLASRRPQKILVSATIPTKSAEIDLLQLHRPLLLKGGDALFSLPANLSQKCIISSSSGKPFSLIVLVYHILQKCQSREKVIVFCSFIESTHRTARMLEMFFSYIKSNVRILELSSRFSQMQRDQILEYFSTNEPTCLVCSDVASRGINFAGARSIINYEFPKSLTKYIHRIGRTARANAVGTSYVIITSQTEARFRQFMADLDVKEGSVEQLRVTDMMEVEKEKELYATYESLKMMVDRCMELERTGKIAHDSALPSNWFSLLEVSEPTE